MSQRPTHTERFVTVDGVRPRVLEWPGIGELVSLVHGRSAGEVAP